jgi:hypothetical protein
MIRDMTAKYAGTCAGCGNPIKRGNRIGYDTTTRKAYHIEHAPTVRTDNCSNEDACCGDLAYEDRCSAACGIGL